MAEKFRVNCSLRDCSAVYGDVRSMLARAEMMNDLGKRFFTNATFSINEDADFRRRNLAGYVDGMIKQCRCADDSEAGFYLLSLLW